MASNISVPLSKLLESTEGKVKPNNPSRSDYRVAFPKIKTVKIYPHNMKSYIVFQKKLAKIAEYDFIRQELKNERFTATINVTYDNNEESNHRAVINLSGRAKDHIHISSNGKIINSLNVKLKTGNILGIVNFKLKLKDKDFIKDEVLFGLIMKHIGAINPYRQAVTVSFQDTTYLAMFEQDIDGKLIEDAGYRESAIIRVNQNFMWDTVLLQNSMNCIKNEGFSENIFRFANKTNVPVTKKHFINHFCKKSEDLMPQGIGYKLVNKKWLNGPNSFLIAAKAFNKLGSIKNNFYSPYQLPNGKSYKILEIFRKYSWHAAEAINLNLYFDPINNEIIPIYMDGSPLKDIDKSPMQDIEGFQMRDIDGSPMRLFNSSLNHKKECAIKNYKLDTITIIDKFLEFYPKSNNVNACLISTIIDFYFQVPEDRPELEQQQTNVFNFHPEIPHGEKKVEHYYVKLTGKKPFYSLCKENNDCSPITEKYLKTLLSISQHQKSEQYNKLEHWINIIRFEIETTTPTVQYYKALDKTNITVPPGTTYVFDELELKYDINITLEDSKTARVIFKNSKIKSAITIRADKANLPQDQNSFVDEAERFDSMLNTACLAFYNVDFSEAELRSIGGGCEDSINLVHSTGIIKQITVDSALQDAIDLDFSSLLIRDIQVKNAGNDCIDFSAGEYNVTNLYLNTCIDKGISIGEQSNVILHHGEISSINTAIAVKDLSSLIIKRYLHIEDYKTCLHEYQKKQEFGRGQILIEVLPSCLDITNVVAMKLTQDKNIHFLKSNCKDKKNLSDNISSCILQNEIVLNRQYGANPIRQLSIKGIKNDTYVDFDFLYDENKDKTCFTKKECSLHINIDYMRPYFCSNKKDTFILQIGEYIGYSGFIFQEDFNVECKLNDRETRTKI